VVGVDAAAVMVTGRRQLGIVSAHLLWLEHIFEHHHTGQEQRDFAQQQRLTGHQGDHFQRHRAHDAGGRHAGHHQGLLHGLVLLLATCHITQQTYVIHQYIDIINEKLC